MHLPHTTILFALECGLNSQLSQFQCRGGGWDQTLHNSSLLLLQTLYWWQQLEGLGVLVAQTLHNSLFPLVLQFYCQSQSKSEPPRKRRNVTEFTSSYACLNPSFRALSIFVWLPQQKYLSLVGYPTRCDLCPETEYRNALIYRWPTHQHYYPFYPTT